jgi:hypothetical protein
MFAGYGKWVCAKNKAKKQKKKAAYFIKQPQIGGC